MALTLAGLDNAAALNKALEILYTGFSVMEGEGQRQEVQKVRHT